MAEPYPVEFRERAVEAYESGVGSYETVAGMFGIGLVTLKRWVKLRRKEGHVFPQKKGGGNRSDVSLDELERIVTSLGDANAGEITAAYNRGRRGKARRHVSSIKRALHRAGFVVKKSASARWSSSGPTSSQSAEHSGD